MKKAIMVLASAAAVCLSARAFAQDAPGNLMVSITVPGLPLQIGAPVKDDLLAGTEKFAQGASKVDEVNLNPATLGILGRQSGPNSGLASKMKLMVVRSYGYDKPGMYRTEDVEAYVKKLEDGSWTCPVISREKDKGVETLSYICAKTDNDHETNELVILSAEPQEVSFIHMAGTMSLNDLTQMSTSAHGLERRIGPHPSVDPQVFVLQQQRFQEQQQRMQDQQQRVQELNRRLSTAPKAETPATPPAPSAPPAQ